MATTGTPVTVSELLTKVTQSTSNIAKHRDAMADIAAQVAQQQQQQGQ